MAVAAAALGATLGATLARPPAVRAHPDLGEVRRELDRRVAAAPADTERLLERAAAARLAGDWDAALADLERAEALGADPARLAAARGLVFLAAGWPRSARSAFDLALARRPDAASIRFARGRAWLALDRPGRAARDFERAIEDMRSPTPDHYFAWRDALVSAGEPERALSALERGIEQLGRVPSLERAAIDLARRLGRREDALSRLARMSASEPHNPAWPAERGDLLAAAGRLAEAKRAWAEALRRIQSRPQERRGRRLAALRRRLDAELTAASREGEPE